ncbi:hypothetical protein LOTGIDRAFT_230712 [Lottia gigantea]|uniref:Uncharacterized protein n=1 Tax=Lottia gigantea TaxID=225164 RepID=V4AVR6_LOTGI|nr:hypothetical protein LOTGIDRAFT_230712 [Lottia gigantea]ESP01453.1 hypothetical protein LOTGIDRAFT_230712 [Lottia gigantea]
MLLHLDLNSTKSIEMDLKVPVLNYTTSKALFKQIVSRQIKVCIYINNAPTKIFLHYTFILTICNHIYPNRPKRG